MINSNLQKEKDNMKNVIKNQTKVFVLAGGKGKRLRPLTFSIPKPLLPIDEKPIIEVLLQKLKNFDLKDIFISLGYKGFLIENYFKDGKDFNLNITYSHEDKILGTAGPLRLVKNHINPEDNILIINGDIYTDLDFKKFIVHFEENDYDIMVGTKYYKHKLAFGVIEKDGNKFKQIVEKPEKEFLINIGIYVIKGNLINYIPDDIKFDMTELLNILKKSDKNIGVYEVKEMWKGIENIDDLNSVRKKISL
jgi:NDP-sugar pyrophosphorylase family protein